MPASNAQLIFEQWKASLKTKDKKMQFVSANFDELWDTLKNAGVTFDDAHALLPSAIKAHQPDSITIKYVWNSIRHNPKLAGIRENEWAANWNKDIADFGSNSFYVFYPVASEKDDDGEPKVYNKMSAREYRLQRNHADQFRPVNLKSLDELNTDLLSEEELLELVRKNNG